MCNHIDGEVLPEDALRLMPIDQSPHSCTTYLSGEGRPLASSVGGLGGC
jgi:hypothetical protein